MTDTAAATAARPAPYEELLRSSSAEAVVRNGWVLGHYPAVPVKPPIDWSFKDEATRSFNYHLHALDMIDPLLAADSAGLTTEGYFERAFAVAVDWARVNSDADAPGVSPMAWYDMAIGLRAYRMAYVYDEARRRGVGSDEERELLRRAMDAHRRHLAGDEGFAAHSNHGLYQACGQLAMARRLSDMPGMAEAADQARRRLAAVIDAQFTEEGVHKEHSPGYHLRVLQTLTGAEKAGLLDTPELAGTVQRARDALTWFVKPSGRLVNFGDTDEAKANLPRTGMGQGLKTFAASGYFVARQLGSYLAQTLAYHSRTHKQADDLSFVWCEQGRDILVDAGRYGYRGKTKAGDPLWNKGFWYGDPKRVFVESTHAHNTVEVDGQSYDRRKDKPYGSALVAAGQTEDGLVYSLGEASHVAQGVHRRLLILSHGRWLLVVDRIAPPPRKATAPAPADEPARPAGLIERLKATLAPVLRPAPAPAAAAPDVHRFSQWFHLAPTFEIEAIAPSAYRATEVNNGKWPVDDGMKLSIASLMPEVAGSEIFVGATEPRLQGWFSPRDAEIKPAPAFAMETASNDPVVFATVLALGEGAVAPAKAEVRDGGDTLALSWSAGEIIVGLDIHGFLGAEPEIELF
ncbi:MAG TPA: heparinase II/III family protein [Caulobacteraceae bacterium]|nr:heparinase II/III family protein [Caulobacteraceae bacterium]